MPPTRRRHEDELEQQALQLRRDWNAEHDDAGTGDAAAPGTDYTTHAVVNYTPAADGPSPLRPAGSDTCVFCGSPDTIWQHDLNSSLTRWRDEYGHGMAWSGSLALCDDCERLWAQSEYWQLLQRQLTSDDDGPDETVEGRLLSIAAFCRADRGPRRRSTTLTVGSPALLSTPTRVCNRLGGRRPAGPPTNVGWDG